MLKNALSVIIISLILASSNIYARELPFTQDDRDRLIRVEEGLKGVNQRINDFKIEVQSLRELIYVVIGGIFVLIGFVIWDRRTALAPAIKKNKELEEREERIERAFKELAKRDKKVADVLKIAGLL